MSGRSLALRPVPLLLLLLGLFYTEIAAKDGPNVKVKTFDHPPYNLNYFEDSDSVIFHDPVEGAVYISQDAGVSWEAAAGVPDRSVIALQMHPFEPETAFVLTEGATHYRTEDRGKKWEKFETGLAPTSLSPTVFSFHAGDPQRIIFNGMDCLGIFCEEEAVYTTNGFRKSEPLRGYTSGCHWAKSSKEFTTGDEKKDKDRVVCIIKDPFSIFKEDQRLVISDEFFAISKKDEIQEFEPNMDTSKGVTGVVNLVVVKKFLLVATASFNSDEMALFVTDDTVEWNRAVFPTDDSHDHSHQITQEGYTILESTNYSIQVDVMTSQPSNPMGVLFTSNSNGTYFTENIPYTNRNDRGHVDFEKISGIQGIYLVNVVANGAEIDDKGGRKDLASQITFDDGRTFFNLKSGEDRLHLHSMTELDNLGRIFSSPAPGLVMGNGNTGKSLGKFGDANLYVSDDAGVHWRKALDGPHKYEFGDSGSVLVVIKDSEKEDVKKFSYSLDHGEKWDEVDLPDGLSVLPELLTTTQDSTSLKFLLLGKADRKHHMIAIDFDGLHERTCGDKDFEDWHARVDNDGKSTCIMGHKQTYRRRKKTADCFIKDTFKDPTPSTEDCDCTEDDFECDYNFQRDPEDNKVCKQAGPVITPEGSCKKPDDTFKGSSGWRLIPGNTCKRTKGEQKDDAVERKCSEGSTTKPKPPANGEDVITDHYVFSDVKYKDYEKVYLDRGDTSSGSDETIIMRPVELQGGGLEKVEDKIFVTHDHGKEWKKILDGEEIGSFYPHEYFNEVMFFTTLRSKKVMYTIDRAHTFHSFDAPTKPSTRQPISFHPDKKDWLLWVGEVCEKVGGSEQCFNEASLSTDRGDNWKTIYRYADRCEFTGHSAYNFRPLKQIMCKVRKEEKKDAKFTIATSDDFFDTDKVVFDGEVTDFATMSEFIVLAREDKDQDELFALASLDGKNFEEAQFPFNFHVEHGSRYTVLDSSTHAVNLFVLTDGTADRERGSIVKSNSNGTSYVLSAPNVNCNEYMYVDFEKIPGLEGVALLNEVANEGKKEKTKKLRTKISHNDGAEWGYLPPPKQDAEGKNYECSSSNGDGACALHLHHYTERDDARKTFAASTAVGLLFGVGNVGSELGDIRDADTFMTTDGGITWKSVKKGPWTWQYGDQGSIIVLVQRATRKNDVKTRTVSYSIDEGKSWKDFAFADSDVTVLDITTVRAGTSRKFLLWCKSGRGALFTATLDFTGLTDKACKETDGDDSDYYLWSPKHPFQDDDCVFGHVATYLRKKTGSQCYNERGLSRLHKKADCECSRRDYECAYNFEMDNHGQCSLVDGLQPQSGPEFCKKNPNATSWFEPTGYRRIPLSTCKGGSELDKTSTEHPCEGYEEEFERKHRTSGVAIFFAVVIPFCVAGGIGYYVYKNWDGKFGQIRLGDGSSSTFDSQRPWIKYPVIAISAVAAILSSIPLLIASLWRSAASGYSRVGGPGGGRPWFSSNRRFTTRDSFARGRGDYTMVDDEGELLGEESDEEV